MKKLQKLVLNKSAKIMTAPQMKHITGGYGGGYDEPGTCCYKDQDGWGYCAVCGVSKSSAIQWMQTLPEGSWCCDSCGTASWSRACNP